MDTTLVDDKRRTTLPASVIDAAGLKPNDQIEWQVEEGEIKGRKIGSESIGSFPKGSLLPYLSEERDKDQLAIDSAYVTGPADAK